MGTSTPSRCAPCGHGTAIAACCVSLPARSHHAGRPRHRRGPGSKPGSGSGPPSGRSRWSSSAPVSPTGISTGWSTMASLPRTRLPPCDTPMVSARRRRLFGRCSVQTLRALLKRCARRPASRVISARPCATTSSGCAPWASGMIPMSATFSASTASSKRSPTPRRTPCRLSRRAGRNSPPPRQASSVA